MHDFMGVEKAPQDFGYVTYLWVVLLSLWGGITSYVSKMKSGVSRFNLMEIFGEMIVSGFAGVMTFYVCVAAHTPEVVTAVAVGISGHMGARAIYGLEMWVAKRFGLPTKDVERNPKDSGPST